MDMTDKYEALVLKGAKFQVMINATINALVPALTLSGVYMTIMGGSGMVVDFLIMNFFLIFFVFLFARKEVADWGAKNNAHGVWYNETKHKDLKKYLHRGFFKNFLSIFVRYNITMALPVIVACGFIYPEAGIPIAHFVFIKCVYSVFLANKVATLGGRLGSIDPKSIKLAQA
ncbi:hypothetical protein L4D76_19575 [Photobacterium sagamiensis]|uniref:hypothetical protein n=1 Tax=Photobacterium sagamiensis TaxID=2910241 RepID=UPI003D0FB004